MRAAGASWRRRSNFLQIASKNTHAAAAPVRRPASGAVVRLLLLLAQVSVFSSVPNLASPPPALAFRLSVLHVARQPSFLRQIYTAFSYNVRDGKFKIVCCCESLQARAAPAAGRKSGRLQLFLFTSIHFLCCLPAAPPAHRRVPVVGRASKPSSCRMAYVSRLPCRLFRWEKSISDLNRIHSSDRSFLCAFC